jgi:sulfopyruvate decarboxylase subunit beta
MKRIEALQFLGAAASDLPVVVTLAATSREMAAVADGDNLLYLLDSMGLAPSVGLGLALALRGSAVDRVLVIEGDGSLFMNPNSLPTAAYHRVENLIIALLDNGTYASTGGFATYSARVDIGRLAEGAGLVVQRAGDIDSLEAAFTTARAQPGPHLLHVTIEPGNAPGIPLFLADPVILAERFRTWLARAVSKT